MSVQFRDTEQTLQSALLRTAENITGETISLRELMALVGEQGLLLFCMLLTVPFLLPISIPGVSTVFGLVIILIGIGVTLNRVPWLPNRLLEHRVASQSLINTLEKGAEMVRRFDHVTRSRVLVLTHGATINRLNGLALIAGGILLLFPFGLVPLSNTLPAFAILFLSIGILQRDGYFIVAGYLLLLATVLYFTGLAVMAVAAGMGLHHLLGAG